MKPPLRINSLTPQDIVEWFRYQSAMFSEMADKVEQTFKTPGLSTSTSSKKEEASISLSEGLNADILREAMGTKAWRLAQFAQELSVSIDVIRPFITPENGFEFAGRGWIKARNGVES